MATVTCWTTQTVPYLPQLLLTVRPTTSSDSGHQEETNTSITYKWSLQYVPDNGHAVSISSARKYWVYFGSTCLKTSTYDINGVTSTVKLAEGYKTYTKESSAQTISIACSMQLNLTWSGTYVNMIKGESSFTVPAETVNTYTITYNANGGNGAPSSQTKREDIDLVLSSTVPSRAGYEFVGWGTSSSATNASYYPGDTYSNNTNITLYAVWSVSEQATYTITYNANGGSGAPSTQTKEYDVNLTLSSSIPVRSGYTFLGWSTSSTATTAAYDPGDIYTKNANATLYAVWEELPGAPKITNLSVQRCDSSGTISSSGTYAKIDFNWETSNGVRSIVASASLGSSVISTATLLNVSTSNTTGTVNSSACFSGQLSIENSYFISITVTDLSGIESTANITLLGQQFMIDFKSGGTGIAFGRDASTDGAAQFGWDIYDKYDCRIPNGLASYTGSSTSAIDPNTTTESLILTDRSGVPVTGQMFYIHTMFYNGKSTTNHRSQYAIPYNQWASVYHRYYYNGTWSDWRRHANGDEITSIESRITNLENNSSGGSGTVADHEHSASDITSGTLDTSIGGTGTTTAYSTVSITKRGSNFSSEFDYTCYRIPYARIVVMSICLPVSTAITANKTFAATSTSTSICSLSSSYAPNIRTQLSTNFDGHAFITTSGYIGGLFKTAVDSDVYISGSWTY